MTTTTTTDTYQAGDVIEDAYANPAVVLRVDHRGRPNLVMQTVGSDRGRVTGPSRHLVRVTNPNRAEWAREVARDLEREGFAWTRNGEGSPEHLAALASLAESRAKVAEIDEALLALAREARS